MSEMLLNEFDLLSRAPEGVARLRELILSLAVRGKLVPQDPNDEPASVLLQRIRAEKERLTAEGKVKRDKPAPPIAEEERLFELPRGWEWARIPDITFSLGQVDPVAPFSYIDVAAIDNLKGVVAPEVQVIAPADAPSRARKVVQVGTVLYSTVRPYLKNIAIVERDYFPEPIASTAFAVMHPYTGIDPRFLLNYFRSAPFTDYVNGKAVGVAYPAINDANFFQGIVPVASTKEQQRIVARVNELMRLCDALEAKGRLEAEQHTRLLDTLLGTLTDSATPEELATNWQRVAEHFDLLLDRPAAVDALEKTVLQLAVRGLLVPQDPSDEPASVLLQKIHTEKNRLIAEGKIKRDKPLPPISEEEKPFELPEAWEWVRVGQISSRVQYGVTASADSTQGVPKFVRITDIQNDNVNWDTVPGMQGVTQDFSDHYLASGDLLIARTGGTIGKSFLVVSVPVEAVFASYLIRISPSPSMSSDYLKIFASSGHYWSQLYAKSMGTGQPNVNGTALAELTMPLPPIAEQARIVARVTELRRICADLRQRLAAGQATRSRLAEALVVSATE